MRRRTHQAVVACTMALALSGCLFDTREPDEPTPGGDACSAIALDVSNAVFEAITCALESEQDAAYERVISERFVFSPTQDDSLDQTWGGAPVYENWNKTVELDVFSLMLSDAQTLAVEFSPSILINQTTFVRYRVEYLLTVVNVATPGDTTQYGGVAQFDVRNEGGNWRLTFWDEVETVPDLSTWGFLKGTLRLRLGA
ncbi:MAG: hypothetical protein L0Z51_00245 [Candidatus Latescibacteria bacterium]|nr:hypothetical protein [Candidatus Latescibacterota bacterium]